jgi:hypothetical protein
MEYQNNSITISKDEAMSAHVDDLLKRQMSLRGEGGIARDVGRKWYYQNWFVFMIVGAIAAIVAWGIIEPYFSDVPYIQGKVENIGTTKANAENPPIDGASQLQVPARCLLTINGQDIWVLSGTEILERNKRRGGIACSELTVGQEIGVYAKYHEVEDRELALAHMIVKDPPTGHIKNAGLTLHQVTSQATAAALMLFPLVAGFVGLAIGAVDGIICRLPRRALFAGVVGLIVGIVAGFISALLAGLAYTPLTKLAVESMSITGKMTGFGFFIQMVGRSLAWMLAGIGMGLGQGIALRSKRLTMYGLLGGVMGGLLGGLLFDPIDLMLLSDKAAPTAYLSRLIGLAVVGAAVGAMIGVVELMTRDSWLRMLQGPLAGKEFLIFKDVMDIGASPRSEIYLFNDTSVAGTHARLRSVGPDCEIENLDKIRPALLNGRAFSRSRLRHGDQFSIGHTTFVFQQRQG